MCIILTDNGKGGNKPPLKFLKECEIQNFDGAGISFINQGKVSFFKGLSAVEVFQILDQIDSHWAIHFRFATIGSNSDELCHPFPVSPDKMDLTSDYDAGTVIMHNGHVDNWLDLLCRIMPPAFPMLPDTEWSDSKAIAYITNFWGETWLNVLADSQKILTMNNESIRLYGNWVKSNQGWYQSKNLYQPKKSNDQKSLSCVKTKDDDWYDTLRGYISEDEYIEYLQ